MNLKNIFDVLSHTELFNSFSSNELNILFKEKYYRLSEYNKNSVIYFQNEICTTIDVILQGEIAIHRIDENGNVFIVSTFSSGDIIGGNLLFANKNTYPMTIICKNKCKILHINKELVLELCQKNKDFLVAFVQSISDKTLILTDKLKAVAMKSIRQCIIDFLTYEYFLQESNVIVLKVSKKELAERFGIQRPSLSRELNKMKRDGLIDFDSKTITIKDNNIIESST